jgi:hypothetical protein
MPGFAVDSGRQLMVATGIVEPVNEWMDTPDGKRRPSDVQAIDENTGMFKWGVEVLYTQTAFGRQSTVTAKVTVGAQDKPAPQKLTPVAFHDLHVEVHTNRAGGLAETWSAEAIADPTTAPKGGGTQTGAGRPAAETASGKNGEKAVA